MKRTLCSLDFGSQNIQKQVPAVSLSHFERVAKARSSHDAEVDEEVDHNLLELERPRLLRESYTVTTLNTSKQPRQRGRRGEEEGVL